MKKKINNVTMLLLNTCQYQWHLAEWFGKRYPLKNICIWNICKRGVVLYYWINENKSTKEFHESFDYDKIEIDSIDYNIGSKCNPIKPLYKVTLSKMPSFIYL